MADGAIVTLDEGRLFALCNPYRVDERVSWHPPGSGGFAPMNSYLLIEESGAILIDTGVTIHRDRVLEQLEALLPAALPLSLLLTRLGEYNTLCNAPAIIERFAVEEIWGAHVNADLWTDFEPHREVDEDGLGQDVGDVRVRLLHGDEQSIELAPGRNLRTFPPALRLLPTHWVYDEATATMFTSDFFGYVTRGDREGPWVIGVDEDEITVDDVRSHLLGTRYWWLAEARTAELATALLETFETCRVDRIAPGHGCVIEGPEPVRRHLEMVARVVEGR